MARPADRNNGRRGIEAALAQPIGTPRIRELARGKKHP